MKMNSEPIDTIEKDNCTINIYPDDCDLSPRDWDNLGTMVCWHSRYNIGDKHKFSDPDDFHEWLKENKSIVLPVYAYIHSGITISTGRGYPYNDGWDSGQLGYIYVTYEQIKKEYGWKVVTKERKAKIEQYLRGEIETYDNYLTGNVYGYEVVCNECESELDSCWGFYGDNWKDNGILDQAYTHCKDCEDRKERELQQTENAYAQLVFEW